MGVTLAFGAAVIVVACAAEQKPSAVEAPSTMEVKQMPSGAGALATDDASAGDIDALAPPPERPSPDPACTAVATRGHHLIGLQQGCVKCPGSAEFVEMRQGDYGKIDREDLIRKRCAAHTDVGAETCTVIFDALGGEIATRARAAGVRVNGVGIMQCTANGFYVTTDDAQMGITLQNVAREVMREWKIRGTLYVRVAPIPTAIPL